jgi:hypothetical protein
MEDARLQRLASKAVVKVVVDDVTGRQLDGLRARHQMRTASYSAHASALTSVGYHEAEVDVVLILLVELFKEAHEVVGARGRAATHGGDGLNV